MPYSLTMLEKTILRYYQEIIFRVWKAGPSAWNGYNIDLEKLSDDEFIEEFMYSISDNPMIYPEIPFEEEDDWDRKWEYLSYASATFNKFLKQHPEQVARIRKGQDTVTDES